MRSHLTIAIGDKRANEDMIISRARITHSLEFQFVPCARSRALMSYYNYDRCNRLYIKLFAFILKIKSTQTDRCWRSILSKSFLFISVVLLDGLFDSQTLCAIIQKKKKTQIGFLINVFFLSIFHFIDTFLDSWIQRLHKIFSVGTRVCAFK